MTIEQLKKLRESEDKVEFKEAKRNFPYNGGSHHSQEDKRKCFLGYVVALANEGGGMLVFGMTDKPPREVVGTNFAEGKIGAVEDQTFIHLRIRIHIEELFENGLRVLVIGIPSRPIGRLMKFEGVPLMRTGDSLRNMSDEEVYSILSEQEPDFSAKICPELEVSDLNETAISKMKEAYSKKQRNSSFQTLSTTQVLTDLKLLENNRLNYAALILLGKREVIKQRLPQAEVIWEFRFTEPQINNDFREVVCEPIFTGIDKIWSLINDKNGNVPIRSDAYIFNINSFNEEVIREAILNAIAHRDYTINSEVVIKQYPKTIIINNPGGFPKGVTLENLISISSTPRSRLMAEVLEKTGLVERSGQGVDKIYSITLSEGKPEPNYRDSNLFQVTLKLEGVLEDKAFHVFINRIQNDRTDAQKLGVEQIIALFKIKQALFAQVKPETLGQLEREGIIAKSSGHTNRYTLANEYYKLAEKEQKIKNRYVVTEVGHFLLALQENVLSIGQLETHLAGSLNRNQIKYLITKLDEDKIIVSEGVGRGTRYKIASKYQAYKGDSLINEVIDRLKELY